jgi:hypothetical protein
MGVIGYVFLWILIICVAVAISRWVFRINDIINKLDDIVRNLQELNAKSRRPAA